MQKFIIRTQLMCAERERERKDNNLIKEQIKLIEIVRNKVD